VKQRSPEEADKAKEQDSEKKVKPESESDDEEKAEDKKEEKSEEKDNGKAEKKDDAAESEKSDSSDDGDSDSSSTSIPEDGKDEHSVGETDQNEVKSIPDAKGGKKKRLESKASISQGAVDDSDTPEDKVIPPIILSGIPLISIGCGFKASWRYNNSKWQAREFIKH